MEAERNLLQGLLNYLQAELLLIEYIRFAISLNSSPATQPHISE